MGACRAPIGNSEFTISEHKVQRISEVQEGCPRHLNTCAIPGAAIALQTWKLDMINKVLCN